MKLPLGLLLFAVGFAFGRADGYAYAGVFSAGVGGMILGGLFVGVVKIDIARREIAEAKAAHVMEEV